jgi:hypothetical protein
MTKRARANAMGVAVALSVAAVAGGTPSRASAAGSGDLRLPATISPAQLLSRFTASDGLLESYSVPIHVEARLHRLFTFSFGLNGTVYYKRPDRVALDMRLVPPDYRHVFGELGTPLTWGSTFDMTLVSANVSGARTCYRLRGTPKQRDSQIDYVLLDVDQDANAPLHVQWFARDGSRIDELLTEANTGVYQLPKHAEAEISTGSLHLHASIDYGDYDLNQTLADSLFTGV